MLNSSSILGFGKFIYERHCSGECAPTTVASWPDYAWPWGLRNTGLSILRRGYALNRPIWSELLKAGKASKRNSISWSLSINHLQGVGLFFGPQIYYTGWLILWLIRWSVDLNEKVWPLPYCMSLPRSRIIVQCLTLDFYAPQKPRYESFQDA